MINPAAVREFLDRPRANSDKAKRFTDVALDRMIARLDPPVLFRTPMWRHQKIAFLLALKYGSYCVFLDPGGGKSRITLELFNYRRRLGKSKRLLVLVPNSANVGGWKEQVEEHTPQLRFLGVDESLAGEERRRAIVETNASVVAITYQGWSQLVTTSMDVKRKGKTVREWVIDKRKAKELESRFDEAVCDESDAIKNHSSLYFKTAKRLMKTCHTRLPLSGSPFNRDPTDLWSQFYIVDKGESLGAHLGLFRAAFFTEKSNYWSGGTDYEFDPRMEEELYAAMRHRSVRFSDEECTDLPKKIGGMRKPIIRTVAMPDETSKHYQRLVDELTKARGNYELMDNTYTRMRMLCSGYLPMKDERGRRVDVPLPQNPKLEALIELLREIPADKKVIVFHEYRTTGAFIAERLTKEKISYVRLFGAMTGNKSDAVARFKKDTPERCRVLLASGSGAKGHNLQRACWFTVFFESFDDPTRRMQAEKRTHRPGQLHPTRFFDLHVRGSIDARILASLRHGVRLFDALMDGTDRLTGAAKRRG